MMRRNAEQLIEGLEESVKNPHERHSSELPPHLKDDPGISELVLVSFRSIEE